MKRQEWLRIDGKTEKKERKVKKRGVKMKEKPLVVKAQDFSLDAVKMIQLTGGKVVLLDKKKY